jgi:TetR/AcrR family transcriptional regulator, upper aerobic nicotinate degradation pathway regulator
LVTGRGAKKVGGRRDAKQGSNRSEKILEAALRLFSVRGYTAVSIQDIARDSKVNSALIYYYFTSKDHLFVTALKYSAQTASLKHRKFHWLQDDPVAEINFWFDTNAKMAQPLGQMLRLMLDYRTTRKRSTSVDRLIADFYNSEVELLRRNIGRGVKSGIFRPVDAEKTALFVSTHLDGLVVAASIRPDYDLRAGLRHMRKVLFAWLGYNANRGSQRTSGSPSELQVVA